MDKKILIPKVLHVVLGVGLFVYALVAYVTGAIQLPILACLTLFLVSGLHYYRALGKGYVFVSRTEERLVDIKTELSLPKMPKKEHENFSTKGANHFSFLHSEGYINGILTRKGEAVLKMERSLETSSTDAKVKDILEANEDVIYSDHSGMINSKKVIVDLIKSDKVSLKQILIFGKGLVIGGRDQDSDHSKFIFELGNEIVNTVFSVLLISGVLDEDEAQELCDKAEEFFKGSQTELQNTIDKAVEDFIVSQKGDVAPDD